MQKKMTIVTTFLLTALLALPAFGQQSLPIAEIDNTGNKLIFYPTVEFERLVLTVTGPCGYTHRQVSTGGELVWAMSAETIDVIIATPADGPSFGTAPSGT